MIQQQPRGAGDSAPSVPGFDPVKLRYRRDGWTPARQLAFILALRACRCVLEACRRVGVSSESAYRLYRRADAESFRRAWNEALVGASAPSPSAAPATSAPAVPAPPSRAPWTAIAVWPVFEAALPLPSLISSTSSTSSPFGAGPAKANGKRHSRQLHHLPRGHQLQAGESLPGASAPAGPRRPYPAYSLEGLIRAARQGSGR